MSVLAVLAAAKTLWDPTILGILAVLSGVVLFCGSVYLLLATNLGARLGFLVAATALSGLLTLIAILWVTTQTPLESPKGRVAAWIPITCPKSNSKCADVASLSDAPIGSFVQLANDKDKQQQSLLPIEQYPQLRPGFEASLVTKAPAPGVTPPTQPYARVASTQSNLLLTQVFDFKGDAASKQQLLATTKDPAQRAQLEATIKADLAAAADPATRQLRSFQFGGGPRLLFWHHPFYSAVEYCPAITPSTDPNVKPNPHGLFCDPSAGTRWFLMQYDYGSIRLPPVIYLLVFAALFAVCLYALHTREMAQRRAARAAGGAVTPAPAPAD
jgi:hypothetical protein